MQISKRYLSIDVLKGMGIMYMLLLHQIIWLFIVDDRGVLRYAQSASFIYGFSRLGLHFLNLQIPVLAATAFYIFARKTDFHFKKLLLRASFLIALEFSKNFLAWGLPDLFAWDVLPFIGLSMLVSYPFLKMSREKTGLACILGLGALAVCFSRVFAPPALENRYLSVIILGDRSGYHFWPFFPWYALFAVGIGLGYALTNFDKKSIIRSISLPGFLLVLLSIATGHYLPVLDYGNFWGPAIFKPHPLFICGVIGMSLVAIPMLHRALDSSVHLREFFARSPFVLFARGILWIYLITVVVGYHTTAFLLRIMPGGYSHALALLPFLLVWQFFIAVVVGRFVSRSKKVEYS